MFGYPAAFLNGNLFAGLHQESFLLRLSERDREIACTKHGGAIFEPMPGRKMREYVALPSAILNRRRALAAWLKKAISYARGLPPKLKRSKAKTKRS